MRIRFKPWARPELEACKFYIDNPEDYKGKWKTAFKNPNNPIHLELGCGKGNFISQIAIQNPDINYIAIDLVDAMLGLAKRNVEQAFKDAQKSNDPGFISKKVAALRNFYKKFLDQANKEHDQDKISWYKNIARVILTYIDKLLAKLDKTKSE